MDYVCTEDIDLQCNISLSRAKRKVLVELTFSSAQNLFYRTFSHDEYSSPRSTIFSQPIPRSPEVSLFNQSCSPKILSIIFSLFPPKPKPSKSLDTKIQRQTQIARSNTISKPIRAQHRRVLIGNAAQLQISTSLLITPL